MIEKIQFTQKTQIEIGEVGLNNLFLKGKGAVAIMDKINEIIDALNRQEEQIEGLVAKERQEDKKIEKARKKLDKLGEMLDQKE